MSGSRHLTTALDELTEAELLDHADEVSRTQRVCDALDLMIRLPQLWRRVEALEVKSSYARFVARRTRDLSLDQASYVDERVAESADGRVPWSRFEDLVTGLIVASDPEAAVRKEQAVAILADPLEAVALMEAFVAWRDRPEGTDPPDVDWSAILPAVTGPSPTPGSVTTSAPTRASRSDPCDLAGQAPVDAYEIPDRHRDAVHLMTPADTFAWGASTARSHQLDHTRAFRHRGPPGQSRIGDYGPMTSFHHRIKTHADWQVRQPFPGIYVWRDPHGATYLVDHSGTRRVRPCPEMSPAEAELSQALFELAA